MLNWQHERYCWVPLEWSETFGRLSFDARALVTYLAKLADKKTGSVSVITGPTSKALARMLAVQVSDRREFHCVVKEALANGSIVADEVTGTVTIPPGKSTVSLIVSALPTAADNRMVVVQLATGAAGYFVGCPSRALVVIRR